MFSTESKQTVLTRLCPGSSAKSNRGFTIVEVMVSVMIFSIGLIGVARLQVVAKQSNYDAVQRVTATTIAQDLLSKMRANNGSLNTYVADTGTNQINYDDATSQPAPVCTGANTCNAEQLASQDLWAVEQDLVGVAEQDSDGNSVGGLTLPTLCITAVDEDGNVESGGESGIYTVAIAWRGKAALSNPTANTCGSATGLYGTNNEYRRLLVFSTFITTM